MDTGTKQNELIKLLHDKEQAEKDATNNLNAVYYLMGLLSIHDPEYNEEILKDAMRRHFRGIKI